ncbi:MAG TPA: response regulator [Candidatus Competibacter sp.]|nr:response regulator [Candidatus Competibacter sp.]
MSMHALQYSKGIPVEQENQPTFFCKLVWELQRLCEEKQSGTLFITTEENQAARFVIKNGVIIGITYRAKHGASTIPFIRNITGGTYSFASKRIFLSYAESSIGPLPSTPEIIRLLSAAIEIPARPFLSQPAVSAQPTLSQTTGDPITKHFGGVTTAPAKKILIVEDSAVTRKVIAKTLLDNGYVVVEAENGLAAFARLNDEKPDLMLLDIIMPGIDGYKVLSMVRKHDKFKNLPVIMLTSRDGLLDKLRGKMGGSDEYLTKPFTPDQLLEKINKYLSNQ